jgi:hypothetical protein
VGNVETLFVSIGGFSGVAGEKMGGVVELSIVQRRVVTGEPFLKKKT